MNNKFIRVGTTYYKIVQRPLQSGDSIETRVPWRLETLRQDYAGSFISKIEKYDGFCCIPSHTNYKPVIGGFLNDYQQLSNEPAEGEFTTIEAFLRHIFEEHYHLCLDYLQLLYTNPMQRLPIILLVSKERNTGKTTFLNLLKAIFGANMTFNTNEDFRSQFNSDWATKLLVAVDEVLLDRKEDSERIKNLSTARSYKSEAKGKDRNEVEFFAKFVLCANNELCPIYIEGGETRYWVRKVKPIATDDPELMSRMLDEIPALLNFLTHREMTTQKVSRMWFDHKALATDALRKIVNHGRSKTESEMIQILQEIIELKEGKEYRFCIADMAAMLNDRGDHTDHSYIRRVLQNNWGLSLSKPIYYVSERLNYTGALESFSYKTGRCFTVTPEILNNLVSL